MPVLSQAQQPVVAPEARQSVIEFDIPRQPLHAALQQYSLITGRSLLYDGKTVRGRMSSPVRGRYRAQDALRLLIAGTGMTARYTSDDAFVLVPEASQTSQYGSVAKSAEMLATESRQRYYAQVQRRVLTALCANHRTRPGVYRLALRFHIDAANAISQLEVHAADRPELEAAARAALAGLPLGARPPDSLRQPLTLLVLPSANPDGGCGAL